MRAKTRTVLLIVTGDPHTSPRPAEAIRIAAGVGAWGKVRITLYLDGEAVAVLSEYADELIDEDNFVRYLPMIGEGENPIYVRKGASGLADLGEPVLDYREIDEERVAQLSAEHDVVIRF